VAEPCATFTEPGTVRAAAAVLPIVTVTPEDAGDASVTVQVVEPLGPSDADPHCRDETALLPEAGSRAIVVEATAFVSSAVRVAVWLEAMFPADAVNVPVAAPAARFTEEGTDRAAVAVLAMTTVVALAGGGVRVTVQVVEVFEVNDAAPHCSEMPVLFTSNEMVADWLEPLREAVSVAV